MLQGGAGPAGGGRHDRHRGGGRRGREAGDGRPGGCGGCVCARGGARREKDNLFVGEDRWAAWWAARARPLHMEVGRWISAWRSEVGREQRVGLEVHTAEWHFSFPSTVQGATLRSDPGAPRSRDPSQHHIWNMSECAPFLVCHPDQRLIDGRVLMRGILLDPPLALQPGICDPPPPPIPPVIPSCIPPHPGLRACHRAH